MIFRDDHIKQMPWLPSSTILVVSAGSRAYGLNRPDSDYDLRGLMIPPKDYYLGFLKSMEQAEMKVDGGEGTLYAVPRFFQLAADCNPNIIEILWSEVFFSNDDFMDLLFRYREAFLSKKARYTFSGYAMAQLKRIHTHRKWLLDPPKKKPEREDFQLPKTSLLSRDILGAIEALTKKQTVGEQVRAGIVASAVTASGRQTEEMPVDQLAVDASFPAHVMNIYQRERAYHNAMQQWQQYETWKGNRNQARAAMEARFGYDTKHAMHLVRLMRMCGEILEGKGVIVRRPDADELMAVRDGQWSYDQLMEFAATQDELMGKLYETSTLPREPDRPYLHQLCCTIMEQYYNARG